MVNCCFIESCCHRFNIMRVALCCNKRICRFLSLIDLYKTTTKKLVSECEKSKLSLAFFVLHYFITHFKANAVYDYAEPFGKTLFMLTPAVIMVIILSVSLFSCSPSFIPFFNKIFLILFQMLK